MSKKQGEVVDLIRDRGFGFIQEDGNRIFFHSSDISDGSIFEDINIGDSVLFNLSLGDKGPIAVDLEIVDTYKELHDYFVEYGLIAPDSKELYDEFCDKAIEYAEYLYINDVTTSMIRNIYSRILGANKILEIKMLRPQFAYTAGRNENNKGLQNFMKLLDQIVRKMSIEEDEKTEREIKNFKSLMEAIVAYRKYVGEDK